MIKYLKDKQYYEDLYDSITIEECKRRFDNPEEMFMKGSMYQTLLEAYKDEYKAKEFSKTWGGFVAEVGLYFFKGEKYAKKEETIRQWMMRDRLKDEQLENAKPLNIGCKHCDCKMECDFRDLHFKDINKFNEDSILFFYTCPKCNKRRAIFEDGEEYLPKSDLCPKCNKELEINNEVTEFRIIITTKCNNCDYLNIKEIEKHKAKGIDKEQFLIDKQKYCMSDEEGMKYIAQSMQMKDIKELSEKEKNKAIYNKIKELNKLKILDLQEILSKKLEKFKFVKLNFKEPKIEKFVIIEFTIYDADNSRTEYDAEMKLKKQIEIILKETNWTLMSDGINYRLGMLSGRLKAYENENDLVELVNRRFPELKSNGENNFK